VASDVLIIGAGLTGLIAANLLQQQGLTVAVLDKGRSVGGRLATRRIAEGGVADHGAQFFTARTEAFKKQIDHWIADGIVYEWSTGWTDGSLKRTHGDGHPRYAAKGGMNQIAKHLAKDLNRVEVNVRIKAIRLVDEGWELTDTDEGIYSGTALLMTPPMPQSLELLKHIKLADDDREALERISFGPCLAAMVEVQGGTHIPEPGAIQDFEDPIYWIADNKAKGISDKRILTIHAGATYSKTNWEKDDETILAEMLEVLDGLLEDDASLGDAQLKRWKYSVPLTTHPDDILVATNQPYPLVFAGDAFGGRGRVEGAFASGTAAGKALLALLGKA